MTGRLCRPLVPKRPSPPERVPNPQPDKAEAAAATAQATTRTSLRETQRCQPHPASVGQDLLRPSSRSNGPPKLVATGRGRNRVVGSSRAQVRARAGARIWTRARIRIRIRAPTREASNSRCRSRGLTLGSVREKDKPTTPHQPSQPSHRQRRYHTLLPFTSSKQLTPATCTISPCCRTRTTFTRSRVINLTTSDTRASTITPPAGRHHLFLQHQHLLRHLHRGHHPDGASSQLRLAVSRACPTAGPAQALVGVCWPLGLLQVSLRLPLGRPLASG